MGIRKMEWDEWIELDNQWLKFHNDKRARLAEREGLDPYLLLHTSFRYLTNFRQDRHCAITSRRCCPRTTRITKPICHTSVPFSLPIYTV